MLPVSGRDAGQHLTLSFTRALSRSDLTLTVQGADTPGGPLLDLAQSTAGNAFVLVDARASVAESVTGDTRTVTVSDIYSTGDPAHPRRFLRLRVAR